VRKNGSVAWLRPDGKTQVTVEYRKEKDGSVTPLRVHTILISTQHNPGEARGNHPCAPGALGALGLSRAAFAVGATPQPPAG
jgi:hypothetical protein